jgi:hypothetical protein
MRKSGYYDNSQEVSAKILTISSGLRAPAIISVKMRRNFPHRKSWNGIIVIIQGL